MFQNETLSMQNSGFSLKNAVFYYGTTFAFIRAKENFHLTER
jgi:hypothetical protein